MLSSDAYNQCDSEVIAHLCRGMATNPCCLEANWGKAKIVMAWNRESWIVVPRRTLRYRNNGAGL
jgi:hypothetical protein